MDPFTQSRTARFLQELQVPTIPQRFNPQESFVFAGGQRAPWPPVPSQPDADSAYGDVSPNDAVAWQAHTGVPQALASDVSLLALWKYIMPALTVVPSGFGWQGACFRGTGLALVEYNSRVDRVGYTLAAGVSLHYSNGVLEDNNQGVVFTATPADMLKISGLRAGFKDTVAASLTSLDMGVLYASWTTPDVWWTRAGFISAVASTDTDLGRVATVGDHSLRMQVYGAEATAKWTTLIVTKGLEAAKVEVASLLATVFGLDTVPLPASVSFRSWPSSLFLWKANVDRRAARTVLAKPAGDGVPVWWASPDISDTQGWAEGCLEAAEATAGDVSRFVSGV